MFATDERCALALYVVLECLLFVHFIIYYISVLAHGAVRLGCIFNKMFIKPETCFDIS